MECQQAEEQPEAFPGPVAPVVDRIPVGFVANRPPPSSYGEVQEVMFSGGLKYIVYCHVPRAKPFADYVQPPALECVLETLLSTVQSLGHTQVATCVYTSVKRHICVGSNPSGIYFRSASVVVVVFYSLEDLCYTDRTPCTLPGQPFPAIYFPLEMYN